MIRSLLQKIRGNRTDNTYERETGVTLIEVIVYIGLFMITSAMVTTAVTSAVNSGMKYTQVSSSQNEMNEAVALIQRDLSLSTEVETATADAIKVLSTQDSEEYEISFFYYEPGDVVSIDGFTASEIAAALPTYPALMYSRRATDGSGQNIQAILSNFDNEGLLGSGTLFSYYYLDGTNSSEATDVDLTQITRIEYNLAVDVSGRASLLQISSSVTPLYNQATDGSTVKDNTPLIPACPANFTSVASAVADDDQARTITVTWSAPSGATSYIITRTETTSGSSGETKTYTIANPDTTKLVQDKNDGIKLGATYKYSIIAVGEEGNSTSCTPTTTTIRPDTPTFVNLNTTKELADVLASTSESGTTNPKKNFTYTVARNLVNQLSWDNTVYGATKYIIYRSDTSQIVATVTDLSDFNVQDTDRNYGDRTTYYIVASNSGGTSPLSSGVTLDSPPASPTLTVTDAEARYDTDGTLQGTQNKNTSVKISTQKSSSQSETKGIELTKYSTSSSTTACESVSYSYLTTLTSFSSGKANYWASVSSGDRVCVRAVAYNDAGSSPYVYDDDTTLPAPFSIKASDYVARRLVAVYNVPASYYDSGGKTEFSYKISLAGDESFGATSYSATGSITSPSNGNSTGTLNTSSLPSNSSFSTSGSTYNGVPGAVTTIKVTSKTNFDETRTASRTFLAYPDSVKRADYFHAHSTREAALVNWYYLRTLYGYATSAQVYAAWLDGQYSNGCSTASEWASEGEKTWNTGSSATVFGLTYSQIALSKAEGRCTLDWDVTSVTDNGQTQSGVKYTSYSV